MSTVLPGRAVELLPDHGSLAHTVKRGGQHQVLQLRVKQMMERVEQSISPYDTAWAAMVPAVKSKDPCFPQCLDWIMQNQHPDGSWAFDPAHPLLVKDSLSSTLACALALRKWNVGQHLVNKGLDFIASNAWATSDPSQLSPLGFDVIFPAMLRNALDINLNLPFSDSSIQAMLHKRELQILSAMRSDSDGKKASLAYLAEGMTEFIDWKDILMKHQRRNGSLFNSPSATAASLLHLHDDKSFAYLYSLIHKNGGAVPTIHPSDVYSRICMVDKLVRLGVDHYFTTEIITILDETYRAWLDGDEEIFLNIPCLAMGFRLLRMNGYEVSSDALAGLDDQDHFFNSASLQFQNTSTILELYRASHIRIFPSEPTLEKMNEWTTSFLKQALLNGDFDDKILQKEVEYDLKYAHSNLERLESRKSIELYKVDDTRLLKTSYRTLNTDDNEDLRQLSLQNFNMCQTIHKKEVESLERWNEDNRIDQLKFARQKVAPCYLAFAATVCSPELVDARCSATKIAVLVTVIDDFFDFAGSEEELQNLIELVEKWERHSDIDFLSEQVEIIFSAVYNTTNEYIEKASKEHGWNVKDHFVETWLELLYSMKREAEWARNKVVPTLDEYMEVGYVSIALGPMTLAPMYFLGCQLSEQVVRSSEFKDLFWHMMMIGRLLNDLASVERERAQGKLNSVLLRKMSGLTEEEAKKETRRLIESHDKELLRMMVQSKGSVVPKACKELFWRSGKALHLFYLDNDGYSSQVEMLGYINSVIYKPIYLEGYSK